MIAHEKTNYMYKDDLMGNYIQLIVHEALQMRPAEHFMHYNNASLRIATHFMELLERQFPIESQESTATQDCSGICRCPVGSCELSDRTVKEITGKPTTTLLTERIIAEAISLLRYTDWSVADIAFALGFEYPN